MSPEAKCTAEIMDPQAKEWEMVNLTGNKSGTACALLPDGRVIIMGGTKNVVAETSTEILDPRTMQSTKRPDMLTPRKCHTAVVLRDGRITVIGGQDLKDVLKSSDILNPTSMSWARGPKWPGAEAVLIAEVYWRPLRSWTPTP